MVNYFDTIALELGVSVWLLVAIFLWTSFWKLIALWKSARKNQIIWFICLAIFNTMGLLEILYIFVFSKMKFKTEKKKKKVKKKKS
jgi:hypothetical protein